jgi:hypothetical protein
VAVREALASGEIAVPRALAGEVQRYLECGQLRCGFVEVRCEACHSVEVVAFSCKGRGLCPSCTTRRSVETAAHLVDWLPAVGYRQWTLSLPVALRWAVLRTKGLLAAVERALVRAIFRWLRGCARALGVTAALEGGATSFLQLFGSALQVTPHFHVLVPEGVWNQEGRFLAVAPPDTHAVEAVLHRALRQLRRRLSDVEGFSLEDDDARLLEGSQPVLLDVPACPPTDRGRLAVAHGFSLHADTAVHPNDRQGLETLCRYGARGALALARLHRLQDGRYEYTTKRGATLLLTAPALLKRLLLLVPPRGLHLTRYHGVFAPNASLRPAVALPRADPPPPLEGLHAPLSAGPRPAKRPRLDWASLQHRTFGGDVFHCACGGRRSVVAVVTHRRTAEAVLANLRLLPPRAALPSSQAPPQLSLGL